MSQHRGIIIPSKMASAVPVRCCESYDQSQVFWYGKNHDTVRLYRASYNFKTYRRRIIG